MNEKIENGKNGSEEKKETTFNIWMILTFGVTAMFIMSLYIAVAPNDPKNSEYKWCVKNYKWGQIVGEYCCVENPYNTTINKCAYYHEGKDRIEIKKENFTFQGVEIWGRKK